MKSSRLIGWMSAGAGFVLAATAVAQTPDGRAIYEKTCAACHTAGLAGAPKLGDAQEWKTRASRGAGELFLSAFRGKNAMPPKGGNAALTTVEVEAAVVYLVSQSTGIPATKVATLPPAGEAPRAAQPPTSKPSQPPAQSAQAAQSSASSPGAAKGKRIYDATCAACHATGAAGAPKLGDAAAWGLRLKAGVRALHDSALKGKNAMPPKGGNASLANADVSAAVSYMLSRIPSNAAPSETAKRESPAAADIKPVAQAAEPRAANGKTIYQATCAACHASGLASAPKLGDAAAWDARVKGGKAVLYASALTGKNAMPAKGGNAALNEAEVKSAVDFMLAQLKGDGAAAKPKSAAAPASEGAESKKPDPNAAPPEQAAPTPAAAPASTPSSEVTTGSNASSIISNKDNKAILPPEQPTNAPATKLADSVPAQTPPASSASATQVASATTATAADPNSFNRLLKPAGKRNLPAAESGIHDPSNDGTHLLQPPLQSFAALPRSNAGNQVDWVKALDAGKINPRMDKVDPAVEPLVLDMNIVREVKGSMPDVVYPHKQHTQWLDCSNCHPAIFIPQKGANQISMAAILLGQKCGVCHGKVAFPVSECRLCHSKNKETKVGESKP